MFNGVIHFIGIIVLINKNQFHIHVSTDLFMKMKVGSSISCSGVCLTVIDFVDESIVVEVSDKTFSCTNLKKWKLDSRINLEPSLRVGDSIDGHFVLGHVDTTANIVELAQLKDGGYKLAVKSDINFIKYITYKGSIALDGVSLTVNNVINDIFYINLLPYSFDNTTFRYNKVGDELNMEIDVLARYVNNFVKPR